MSPNPQFSEDLVTFTEEILNGQLHVLCNEKVSDLKCTPRIPTQMTAIMVNNKNVDARPKLNII